MEAHFKLSDAAFERQFIDCTLPPSLFSHEAHLRLAWIIIKRDGITQAETDIQRHLQRFVASVGATDKYHVTLTVAAVRAVGHFQEQSEADDFKDFIQEFPQLKNDFKALIGSHYSYDVFSSAAARSSFMEPDLLPLS